MKQILKNIKTGETTIVEVLSPPFMLNMLRIKTSKSLISAGTVKMHMDFGRAHYFDKTRQQLEKVVQVIQKIGKDGPFATIITVFIRTPHDSHGQVVKKALSV